MTTFMTPTMSSLLAAPTSLASVSALVLHSTTYSRPSHSPRTNSIFISKNSRPGLSTPTVRLSVKSAGLRPPRQNSKACALRESFSCAASWRSHPPAATSVCRNI